MKRFGWIIALLVVGFIAFLVYGTLGQRRYRVEVCVDFHGRSACRAAAAATESQAVRTATENACALISSGMTDSIACGNTPPKSVRWIEGK